MTSVSVIIPAHNEAGSIERCLTSVLDALPSADVEVVVVPNGCTDATAKKCRQFASVKVVEIPEASKIAALNAGDAAASALARIYLDADVSLDSEAMTGLVDAVLRPDPIICAPHVRFETKEASRLVRAFYDVHAQLPSSQAGVAGHGVYGLSASGRARFESFPPVLADDLFASRLFAVSERVRVAGLVEVYPPRSIASLVRVRTRIARGNAALPEGPASLEGSQSTLSQTLRALFLLVIRHPTNLLGALVFVAVTVISRLRSRGSGGDWAQDRTAREVT